MVMQDGGAVDVRPGPDPGRAAPEHSGGYLAAGLSLGVYGVVLCAWAGYDLAQSDALAWDFVEALVNPGVSGPAPLLGPYEWAFAVASLAVGGLAMAQRRAARSGALLLACLLLAVSLREGVGLLDADYRDQYSTDPLGGWALATRGLGLLAALVVATVLARATEQRGHAGSGAGRAGGPGAWRLRASRVCGVLFLVMGAGRLGWLLRDLSAPEVDAGRYLRDVVDASEFGTLHLAAVAEFTTLGSVIALLALGVLACRGRRDVRGALLVFAGMQLYLTVRTVVWLAVTDFFNRSLETTEGALSLATTAFALTAMTSVVVLTTGRPYGPYETLGGAGETFHTAPAGRHEER